MDSKNNNTTPKHADTGKKSAYNQTIQDYYPNPSYSDNSQATKDSTGSSKTEQNMSGFDSTNQYSESYSAQDNNIFAQQNQSGQFQHGQQVNQASQANQGQHGQLQYQGQYAGFDQSPYQDGSYYEQCVPRYNDDAYFASHSKEKHVKKPTARQSSAKSILSFVFLILIIFGVAFVLREYVFGVYEVPSGSMEKTILPGDMVFAEKVTHNFTSPKRGDIITFIDTEDSSRVLIKRVVATAGQTVKIKDNKVFVDDVMLDEPYTDNLPNKPLKSDITYPYTVPEGCVWVMGDNRTNSQDSRYYGAVPESNITGKALFIYWPTYDAKLLLN